MLIIKVYGKEKTAKTKLAQFLYFVLQVYSGAESIVYLGEEDLNEDNKFLYDDIANEDIIIKESQEPR
jgi:hypothetical protein